MKNKKTLLWNTSNCDLKNIDKDKLKLLVKLSFSSPEDLNLFIDYFQKYKLITDEKNKILLNLKDYNQIFHNLPKEKLKALILLSFDSNSNLDIYINYLNQMKSKKTQSNSKYFKFFHLRKV